MGSSMSRPLRRRIGLAALVLAACAGPPSPAADTSPSQGSARDVITRTDLEGHEDLSAFEAIRRLRPTWLRYRGQAVLTSPEREGLRVYLDGSYFGDAAALGQLRVVAIQEIRFLDARRATMRFGTGHTVGAIVVTTRRDG